MQLNLLFDIGDSVKILSLDNMRGRIVSILITPKGIKYEVRCFWDCTAKEVYFYEDELIKQKEENKV